MTIEIFKHESDASVQAEEYGNMFGNRFEVAKVEIDETQADIYGFRFLDYKNQVIDSLAVGFIVVDDEDWTVEEAASCGLKAVAQETA